MEFTNPIMGGSVINHLTHDCWQEDPKFGGLEMPAQQVEVNNDVYERQGTYLEFDPYDAEIVDNGYYEYGAENSPMIKEEPYIRKQESPQKEDEPSFYSNKEDCEPPTHILKKRKFISAATLKRRERLGLQTDLAVFPGKNKNQETEDEFIPEVKVKFQETPSVISSNKSLKSTAATRQRQNRNSSSNFIPANTEPSILRSPSNSLKEHKISPHYKVKEKLPYK